MAIEALARDHAGMGYLAMPNVGRLLLTAS